MKTLTQEQIKAVIKWMNGWQQLENTAIPLRFNEYWTEQLLTEKIMDKIFKLLTDYSAYRGQPMYIVLTHNRNGWVEDEFGEKAMLFKDEKELFTKIENEMCE